MRNDKSIQENSFRSSEGFVADDSSREGAVALATGAPEPVATNSPTAAPLAGDIGSTQDIDTTNLVQRVGTEFLVNTQTANAQQNPTITGLSDGGFVVSWQDASSTLGDTDGTSIKAQVFQLVEDNHAPLLDNPIAEQHGDEDAPFSYQVPTDTFSDADSDTLSFTATLSDASPLPTWLAFDADTQTFSGTPPQDYNGTLSLTVTASDASDSVSDTFDLIIDPANDAPTGADVIRTIDEDTSYTFATADFGFSDVDGDSLAAVTINLVSSYGTLYYDADGAGGSDPVAVTDGQSISAADIAAGLLTFAPYPDENGTDYDNFQFQVDDGVDLDTDPRVFTFDVTPINDAPILDLDQTTAGNDALATFYEGYGAVLLAPYAILVDDNEDYAGGTLTITIDGATAADQLTIDTSYGDIGVSGSDLTYYGDVVGSFTGGGNGNPLVFTFSVGACGCSVEALMESILFDNTADIGAPITRLVDFTLVDGPGGDDTGSASVSLTLQPEVAITGDSLTLDEDTAAAVTGLSITGVSADPANDLITVHLGVLFGTLTIDTGIANGVTASDITGGANGSADIGITATQDAINLTFADAAGVLYQGDADYYGSDDLAISASSISTTTVPLSNLGPPLALGTPVTALAFTDIDNDGFADLAFGLDGAIIVFSNTLSGAYGLPGGAPDALAFGDFDGDSLTDIAFASYDAAGNGYVGYASTTIDDVVVIASVDYAYRLVTGDFNGDTLVDLAVTDADNGRVAILLQDTPGTFLAPAYTPGNGLGVGAIALGDFNGDAIVDLLVANIDPVALGNRGSVDLMLGNGDGSFQIATTVVDTPSLPTALAVGDLNDDGFLDFVFSSIDIGDPGSTNGVVAVLGNGDGTFQAPVGYDTSLSGAPKDVTLADLNGDDMLDLVVANNDDPGTVSVLAGNGDGTFGAAIDFDTGSQPNFVAAADPDGDSDLDLAVGTAGDGEIDLFNNDSGSGATISVDIAIDVSPVDDASIAVDDNDSETDENANVTIDVRSNDTDVDGFVDAVTQIDGHAATVGVAITLASGATVTLESYGELTYDPNGAFDYLISDATAFATSARNTSADDSFSYTLAGGGTATVNLAVDGVTGPGDQLWGSSGDNDITGTDNGDLFNLSQGGADAVSGGGGDDGFLFGGAFDAGDTVDGGAGALDQIGLQGDYSGGLTLAPGSMTGVEYIVLLPGDDARFGGETGTLLSYSITTDDANVAAGETLYFQANTLRAGESFTLDASSETDGTIFTYGGFGDDTIIGGQSTDAFYFGTGRFGAGDLVDGLLGSNDTLALQGDYSGANAVTFGAGQIFNIDILSLVSSGDARFGGGAGIPYSYDIIMDDSNLLSGDRLTVSANGLHADEVLTFDGSAESDGFYTVYGGDGADTITGGQQGDLLYGRGGADMLTGGSGDDVFAYSSTADSNAAASDTILDFLSGSDRINLVAIDANTTTNGNQAFTFFGATETTTAGSLYYEDNLDGSYTLYGNTDSDGTADLVIHIVSPDPILTADIVL